MANSSSDREQKIRVGILFGGKSAEHEVSLASARNVLQALDKTKFEPILIGIDKSGKWHYDAEQVLLDSPSIQTLPDSSLKDDAISLLPGSEDKKILGPTEQVLDVVFPILHGPMGEDGSIQGFLELANIPYVGTGILGSAVGMDKDVMKRLLREAGIPVTEYEVMTASGFTEAALENVVNKFSLPLFVKPANMGSSVGVSKAEKSNELRAAVEEAFRFDSKVLIEKAIRGDEIECAVLGNADPKASIIGRIIPRDNDFYSYEAKYIDEDGAILEIPANIPEEVAEKARETAVKAFKVLSCEGMSRVDMFATEDGTVMVNEVNTIPGFTKISMYPKLWEASGISYTELVTLLINLAMERYEQRKKLSTNYENHI